MVAAYYVIHGNGVAGLGGRTGSVIELTDVTENDLGRVMLLGLNSAPFFFSE